MSIQAAVALAADVLRHDYVEPEDMGETQSNHRDDLARALWSLHCALTEHLSQELRETIERTADEYLRHT